MKAWKYVVLVGGLAGVLGFFLPFLKGTDQRTNTTISFSAFDAVKGLTSIKEAVHDAKEAVHDAKEGMDVQHRQNEEVAKELEDGINAVRGLTIVAFAPAALLLVFGILGVVLKRFQRLSGFFAFLVGGASASIWALISAAAGEAKGEGATLSLQMGVHMLLIAGLAGLVAGLGALVKPDRG